MTAHTGLSLFWFFFIIVLIPVSLWFFKRWLPGGLMQRKDHNPTQLISTLPLGPQQRIVTIETNNGSERQWLVLGVTGQSITTLHTMAAPAVAQDASVGTVDGTEPALPGTASPLPSAFGALLKKMQRPQS